jgi:hypothetical protein
MDDGLGSGSSKTNLGKQSKFLPKKIAKQIAV